jgi:energy-converting hydrogenase Eha subunit C
MNTKLLMSASAIVLGVIGILLTFMPQEISQMLLVIGSPILFQLLGALYFAFAMLNSTAKGNLIGGIYSRPVAVGNFAHFIIGGLALIKLVLHQPFSFLSILAVVYTIFAVFFGWVFFTNPVSKANVTTEG